LNLFGELKVNGLGSGSIPSKVKTSILQLKNRLSAFAGTNKPLLQLTFENVILTWILVSIHPSSNMKYDPTIEL